VYAAIAPWSEKDNSYYFFPAVSVWAKPSLSKSKQPGKNTSSTLEQQQILLQGSPEPIAGAGRRRYAKVSGLPAPLREFLPILERQLRDASVKAIRQKL